MDKNRCPSTLATGDYLCLWASQRNGGFVMPKQYRRRVHGRGQRYDTKRVLHALVDANTDASRFLQLYYWATEPQLDEFMRNFLALPDPARRALMAFLQLTQTVAQSVGVEVGNRGALTLSSPLVSKAMQITALSEKMQETSDSMH